ncbi:unnamed protein product [Candidula unifasciata]|uniref:Multidrug resistance-associated protein 4-like n=1 Tax=Candidula unifasciata TaxID=100452 RepID=A0A8S3YG87_9EUPU|nr:unnamed protein product [Candidula unifasciata]
MADHSARACPYDRANIFSKITFWWMNALFKLGSSNHLTYLNVCDVSSNDESSLLHSKLERYWKEEVQKYSEGGKASLLRAVLKSFMWQWITPGLLVCSFESIKLVQPYLIGLLVSYLNDDAGAVPLEIAYGIGGCLGLSAVLQICLNPTYFFVMQHVAMRMKVAVGALIYRKVLSLSSEAFQTTSAGQIVNLLSTDIEKFNSSIDLLHYLWVAPLSIVIVMYLIYRQIGASCFWGLGVIVIIVPLQVGLSTAFGKLGQKIGACSDRRMQLMSEVVIAMKVIKIYCWEQPFQALISKLRRQETIFYCLGAGIKGLNRGMEEVCMRGLALTFFLSHYYMAGYSLEPLKVFFILSLLDTVRLTGFYFPHYAAEVLSQLLASTQRVQAFLLLDEEKEQIKDLRLQRFISYHYEPRSDWAVDIDHMTARWPLVYTEGRRRFQKKKLRSSTSSTKSLLQESDLDHAFSLKYVSLQIKKGELLAVVGVTGSGKSSLLMCLIGELPYEIGQISINGRVSYCGQTNWIFSGTVKDNILFGHSLNRNRYQLVIEACGLTQDLELLPKGDQTYVGERGLQLSGGQKARISLARCVYHDADVYLLDDPLSSVDSHVGLHIFQRCIKDFLREKTVILVTHQLQYLKQVDRILVLRDGSIYDSGTYDELKLRGVNMKALTSLDEHPKHISEAAREAEEEEIKLLLESKHSNVTDDGIEGEDEVQTGCVGFRVYWEYFCAGYGPALLAALLPLWIAGPALYCLSDWMLTQWLRERQRENLSVLTYGATNQTASSLTVVITSKANAGHNSDDMPFTLETYIVAVATCSVAFVLYAVLFLQMAAMAGQRLHDRMLKSVMNAVVHFFDTHSVGQVLNRFSRDLGFIDNSVSVLGYVVSMKTMQYLGFFLVTVIANPWLTIAIVPLLVFIVLIWLYALRTLRQIKRLEAKARSPVYSHMSDTILGLETIRALGKKDQFLAEFDEHQNNHTAAWFLYLSSYRWMSVRSLAVIVLYMIIIIFVSLGLKETLDGNLLALSLIYCISMAEPFEFYTRAAADLETYMTSVERVLEYSNLEQEPPKTSDKPPSPDWPNRGAITFNKISLQYSPGAPLTLKNIECHIQGKEKIGIVGRTGSGKSSLITSLFRLVKPTGAIYIDGVDIGKLGLYELRSRISVIPQDPVLFSQTLRWNLDPLNEYSDERLWNALEQVCFIYVNIVFLHQRLTDTIIQRTLRAKFRDSTVLTIAHRLYTVMDCDRIMVLEDGELKEFDTPYNLLQNSDGIFTRLVLSTGKNSARQLQALAELSQHQRTSASLQLHRAMLLANEQLAQSTEDLSSNKAVLSWNRFTHSQDSLEKAHIENIIEKEKEKKTVAPSRKIITRRSPGRTKKTVDERNELINYDTPPRAHTDSHLLDRKQTDEKLRHYANRSQTDNKIHPQSDREDSERSEDVSEKSQTFNPERKILIDSDRSTQSKVDSSRRPVTKGQSSPSHKSSEKSRENTNPQQSRPKPDGSQSKDLNSRTVQSTRILSGPYVSLAQDELEEFV